MADQGREGILSPILRHYRLYAAMPYIQGTVLDWGCGSGALARHISPEKYVGVDIDAKILEVARSAFPRHTFLLPADLPATWHFDTVVALAVIEHLVDPVGFLRNLAEKLPPSFPQNGKQQRGSLVLTTPKPQISGIHTLGAHIGLFSRHANEEHHSLLDEKSIKNIVREAGLIIVHYGTFLFNLNQIVVVQRA